MNCDTHKLMIIYQSSENAAGVSEVVRWCKNCGAIVVDRDVDNRTQPGAIMKMEFPKVNPTPNYKTNNVYLILCGLSNEEPKFDCSFSTKEKALNYIKKQGFTLNHPDDDKYYDVYWRISTEGWYYRCKISCTTLDYKE